MKIIRNWVTLAGLSVVVFALCAAGARAQSLRTTHYAGTFTLPFEAHWGQATLPAGQYSLYYGRLFNGGVGVVEVIGKENRSPHVFILPWGVNDATATRDELICVREGNAGVIRTLEMPETGTALNFKMPRGTQLMAKRSKGGKNVQMAEGPKLIQRIPITLASR